MSVALVVSLQAENLEFPVVVVDWLHILHPSLLIFYANSLLDFPPPVNIANNNLTCKKNECFINNL